MSSASVEQSKAHCHEVVRKRARNFYYGLRLTPEPKRSALYAVYAWMRRADDLVDEAGSEAEKLERLAEFERQTRSVLGGGAMPDAPFWPAIGEAVERYEVPLKYLEQMIEGQRVDLRKTRYATFDELYDYCYKVASTVGLTCIEIWGYEGEAETRQLAEWRGIAFQLTNILRDIREDAQRDRVYLPAEDFDVFELTPSMFLFGPQTDAMAGIRKTVARAADYYDRSAALADRVHPDGRPCLWAMTSIYQGIFEKIQRRPASVLEQSRVRLASWRKGLIALRASLGRGSPGASGRVARREPEE